MNQNNQSKELTRRQVLGGLLGVAAAPQVLRSQAPGKPPNDGWVEKENIAEKAEHATVRREMEQKLQAFWKW